MAAAFLLDSNILFSLMAEGKRGHEQAWKRLRSVPEESILAVSAIALAEADVGCYLQEVNTAAARADMSKFVQRQGFLIEPVTEHTAPYYGELKAKLIKQYQPKRTRWPERWKDKPSAADISVEEPDLLMAAQAMEHGYILVTGDGMDRIREVLTNSAHELEFEDWTNL
jgi:predicted nucleic acid-binding protein